MSGMLNMLEFFEIPVQLKVLNTFVNLAKSLALEEDFNNHIIPIIPVCTGYLEYRGPDFYNMTEKFLCFF